MFIYLALLGSCIIGCLFDFFQLRIRQLAFFFNLFLLFLVSVLRYNIGVDYEPYSQLFQESVDLFNLSYEYFIDYNDRNIEYGYLFLQSLIKTFTNDFEFFILVYNVIIFYLFTSAIIRNPYRNIQLFIFLCFIYVLYVIEAHRQAMAMAIFIYNIKYLLDKKLSLYLFFVILGTLFHSLSIISLPVYFLIHYVRISRNSLIFFLMGIIFFVVFEPIASILEALSIYDSAIIRRVNHYYFVKSEIASLTTPISAFLQRFLLFVLVIIFVKKVRSEYSFLIVIYISLFMLFSNVGVLAGRVSGLFLVAYLYYFSDLFLNVRNVLYRFVFFMLLIVWGSMIYIKDVNTIHPDFGTYNYIPYKTILEKR